MFLFSEGGEDAKVREGMFSRGRSIHGRRPLQRNKIY